MNPEYWLVGVIVLVTHCLEGITGFGCTALALPFVVMVIGVKAAVPVLVVLAWLLAGYIVIRAWRHIRWREYGFILLYVGLGFPIGMAVFRYLSPAGLKLFLAGVMVVVGGAGLVKTWRGKAAAPVLPAKRPGWGMKLMLFVGGIVHGAFGSGGPLVIVYAARALPEKALFRVTICLLWFTLNTVLMVQWTVAGDVWTPEIGRALLYALPFLGAGALVGDYLHHRTNEYYFKLLVYGILILSAIGMFLG